MRIREFGLDPTGAVAMDIGSSTGGFTQVLLHHGAAHVFAVDVGTNQLGVAIAAGRAGDGAGTDQCPRADARHHHPAVRAGWSAMPASSGSPKCSKCRCNWPLPQARVVALIKPQFEVAKGEVGKGGIVRDPALHQRVCDEVTGWLEASGWRIEGLIESPITGTEGNVEFLVHAVRGQ